MGCVQNYSNGSPSKILDCLIANFVFYFCWPSTRYSGCPKYYYSSHAILALSHMILTSIFDPTPPICSTSSFCCPTYVHSLTGIMPWCPTSTMCRCTDRHRSSCYFVHTHFPIYYSLVLYSQDDSIWTTPFTIMPVVPQ